MPPMTSLHSFKTVFVNTSIFLLKYLAHVIGSDRMRRYTCFVVISSACFSEMTTLSTVFERMTRRSIHFVSAMEKERKKVGFPSCRSIANKSFFASNQYCGDPRFFLNSGMRMSSLANSVTCCLLRNIPAVNGLDGV